ncbi:hypothetical protein BHE74_00046843 [Ensete ventricosum]|nr:hypothetical protein BHE74_00046843 [Ensete ventricosum]
MGACATKPMAQGDAPPPMEPDPQVEDGGGGQEVEQGPAPAPADNRRRSLGQLFKVRVAAFLPSSSSDLGISGSVF